VSDALLDSPVVQSIGWALVNSIWQGTLIGVSTALALRAVSGARANTRYLVACAGLLLMLLVPLVSVFTSRAQDSLDVVAMASSSPDIVAVAPIDRILLVAVVVWVVGVALLSVRLVAACLGIERMKRATRSVDESLALRVRAIAHRFGVERSVQIFESTVVPVPTVVGYLRPMILLPASVISGLPAAHLDAVLAHELAHVRRHDYLVNVLQSIIETLLFYHPAVWWCSRQIRMEREHCCDDLVVEACGDRVGYATTLAQLEELRGMKPMLSMNVTGGRLIDRIRRVLKPSPANDGQSTTWMIVPALTLVAVAIVLAPALTTAEADSVQVEPRADRALPELAPMSPLPPRPPRAPRQVQPASPAEAPAPPAPPAPPSIPAPPAAPAFSAAPVQAVPPAPPVPLPASAAPTPPGVPAAPAPPGVPAAPAPPDAPLPPVPPVLPGDVTEIADELNRAAAELVGGFDEMRRAAQEIARQQVQVTEVQAALEKMKNDTLAKNADIEAMGKSLAELNARHAALRELPDMTEMRKQIDAMRQELQKLRAR
jgi:beta-lactamase regulating signal transducer with metallopeptidase domain